VTRSATLQRGTRLVRVCALRQPPSWRTSPRLVGKLRRAPRITLSGRTARYQKYQEEHVSRRGHGRSVGRGAARAARLLVIAPRCRCRGATRSQPGAWNAHSNGPGSVSSKSLRVEHGRRSGARKILASVERAIARQHCKAETRWSGVSQIHAMIPRNVAIERERETIIRWRIGTRLRTRDASASGAHRPRPGRSVGAGTRSVPPAATDSRSRGPSEMR